MEVRPHEPHIELVTGRPVYRYYITWTISGQLALEVNFSGVTWSRQIRRAGSFTGKVSFENDDRLREAYYATMPAKMSLYVTRNNKPVWGGLISRRSYDASTRELQVEATGFESYMYRRTIWHTTSRGSGVDQYQVVRNLIGLMQSDFQSLALPGDRATPHPDNANIGILVDPRNSGKFQDNLTYHGHELQSFGDAIETLSNNLNGFEYNIEVDWNTETDKFVKRLVFRDTPPSQLPVGTAYTGQRPGLDENFFEFPGNIISLTYDDSGDAGHTRQWVLGKQPDPVGEVEQPTLRAAWENQAYMATQWPVLDGVESSKHSDVSVQATLDRYASSYGQQNKPPAGELSVTVNGAMNPHVGSFGPGDWCRLVVTDPFLSQALDSTGNETKVLTKRIKEFTVAVPDTEQIPEVVSLTLIDEWNDDGGF